MGACKKDVFNNNFPDTEYHLLENIPSFHKIKKNKNTTAFDYIYNIEDNIKRTAGILITGKDVCSSKKKKKDLRLGDKYSFVSGICGEKSDPVCRGKPRHIIVDNTPINMKDNEGLIPSIIGDLTDDLNPGNMMNNFLGMGKNINSVCKLEEIVLKKHYPNRLYSKKVKLCTPNPDYLFWDEDLDKETSFESYENYESLFLNDEKERNERNERKKKYMNYCLFIFLCFLFFILFYCYLFC
tara:strand:+ start:1919 stop:2638 length:720 start_codon:yes stop_codon:yes gene_type:complete